VKIKKTILHISILVPICSNNLSDQKIDNGNGSYTNQLICVDFPYPDVIRVDPVHNNSVSRSIPAQAGYVSDGNEKQGPVLKLYP